MIFITRHYMEAHGSARSARDFIRAALTSGASLHVASPSAEDTELQRFVGHDRELVWHRYSGFSLLDRFPGPRRTMRYLREQRCRRTVQAQIERDWTVVNGWASVQYWGTLRGSAHARSAIIVRESPRHFEAPDRAGFVSRGRMLERLSDFDRLIFVSERVQDEWKQFDGLSRKPSFVLPNCCEEEEIEALLQQPASDLRSQLGIRDGAFLITLVGSIEQRKGHDVLLSALSRLVRHVPHAHVLLVGNAATAWGRRLLDTVSSSHAGQVSHLAAQKTALPYLLASDVVAVPSRAEALPRCVLEAMCLGKPIVASNVDGIPELIDHGQHGLLFPSGDPETLAEALHRIASDPVTAHTYGENARTRYYRDFSRASQVGRMGQLRAWLREA